MSSSTVRVTDIPDDANVWQLVAKWSITQWGANFPDDTLQTYIDLYARSCTSATGTPKVFVAWDGGHVVGTVTLVDDDELPGATEPGPWLAALFVRNDMRGRGIGRQLVLHCEERARSFGVRQMWLYTPEHRAWYEALGWTFVRNADLHGTRVDVMEKALS